MKALFCITLAWPIASIAQPAAPASVDAPAAPVSAPASAAPASAGPAAPASVADDPVARAANRGKRAYDEGRYLEAAVAYQEAYRLEPVATLLYNIAYIYDEHLNDRALAVDYYRRYVNAPDAETDSRLRAYQRIALLEKAPAAAPPTAAPVAMPATAAPVIVQQRGSGGQTTTGAVLLGVGGASLITSGVLALLNASTHSEFESETDRARQEDLADTGKAQALGADIALGIGVALATTGLVLVLTDDSDGPTLSPGAGSAAAGLSLGGQF